MTGQKTRKNRISKKQRTECFLTALWPMLDEYKRRYPAKTKTTERNG